MIRLITTGQGCPASITGTRASLPLSKCEVPHTTPLGKDALPPKTGTRASLPLGGCQVPTHNTTGQGCPASITGTRALVTAYRKGAGSLPCNISGVLRKQASWNNHFGLLCSGISSGFFLMSLVCARQSMTMERIFFSTACRSGFLARSFPPHGSSSK